MTFIMSTEGDSVKSALSEVSNLFSPYFRVESLRGDIGAHFPLFVRPKLMVFHPKNRRVCLTRNQYGVLMLEKAGKCFSGEITWAEREISGFSWSSPPNWRGRRIFSTRNILVYTIRSSLEMVNTGWILLIFVLPNICAFVFMSNVAYLLSDLLNLVWVL